MNDMGKATWLLLRQILEYLIITLYSGLMGLCREYCRI